MIRLSQIRHIVRYTVLETVHSRVYYNVFFLGFALFILSFVASELTYGVPERIAIDFGLGLSSLAAVGIAIFLGSGLISKEIENRTIYMMLSRPLTRLNFLLGKIFGLFVVLFLNTLILYSISLLMYFFLGGTYSSLLFWCFLFVFFEAAIILLVVILFSLVCNQTLSIIISLSVFAAGHSLTGLSDLVMVKSNPFLSSFVSFVKFIIPNFSKINIKDFVIYKKVLPVDFLMGASMYSLLLIMLLLVVNIFIFNRRSLD